MISKMLDGYEVCINDETNKVDCVLIGSENGFEKLHPYIYDNAYNCWTNASGYYGYRTVVQKYYKGEIIFR